MDRINSLIGITQTVRTADVPTVESLPKTTRKQRLASTPIPRPYPNFVCHLHLILLDLQKLLHQNRPQAMLVENPPMLNTRIR